MIGRLERREDAGSKAYHRASVGITCGESVSTMVAQWTAQAAKLLNM